MKEDIRPQSGSYYRAIDKANKASKNIIKSLNARRNKKVIDKWGAVNYHWNMTAIKLEKNHGKLIIITGIPGAGKSTLAAKMVAQGQADCFFEADQWMIDNSGNYLFQQDKLKYCHEKCFRSVYDALRKGLTAIQSNTNLQPWECKKYVELARSLGADVEIIHLHSEYGSIHGVPAQKLKEMKERRVEFKIEDF